MASRENQGLQIALILFVLITIALAVTTFAYYRKAEDKIKEAVAARQVRSQAETERDKALFQVQALKFMLGYGDADLDNLPAGDQEMQTITVNFSQDMEMYGEGLTAENRNYRNLPANMEAAIRKLHQQVTAGTQREKALGDEKTSIEDREIARAKKAEDTQVADAKKYADERSQFVSYQESTKTRTEKLIAEQGRAAEQFKSTETRLVQEKTGLEKEVGRLATLLGGAQQRLEDLQEESFEGPDGRITLVNQRTRMVWINLGMADGLRRQTTFSIYDRDESGVMNPDNKGSIEVTQILDQHLAEARILEDDVKQPILPGDLIHSPAFRPGRKVSFAIAGFIDIDGDGASDRDLLRNLITMSGAVITAEAHDDGQQTGRLGSTTRYLILGETPTDKSGAGARQAYTKMHRDAKELGIKDITLDEFLSFIGWKGEVKTIQLGRGASADDFPARSPTGVVPKSTGQTSEIFRPRQPGQGR